MRVSELIEILKACDPELPIAAHANNHTSFYGSVRVVLLGTYNGDHVCIGNVSKMNINAPNWYAKKILDSGKAIPVEWPQYTARRGFDCVESPQVREWSPNTAGEE